MRLRKVERLRKREFFFSLVSFVKLKKSELELNLKNKSGCDSCVLRGAGRDMNLSADCLQQRQRKDRKEIKLFFFKLGTAATAAAAAAFQILTREPPTC